MLENNSKIHPQHYIRPYGVNSRKLVPAKHENTQLLHQTPTEPLKQTKIWLTVYICISIFAQHVDRNHRRDRLVSERSIKLLTYFQHRFTELLRTVLVETDGQWCGHKKFLHRTFHSLGKMCLDLSQTQINLCWYWLRWPSNWFQIWRRTKRNLGLWFPGNDHCSNNTWGVAQNIKFHCKMFKLN